MGALVITVLLCVAYLVGLGIYRLYFHPLAKFPGPKLAGLSKWYEFYYEVVKKGRFGFHINDLRGKYGPIVRIAPEEVHIKDSSFWDTLYVRPKAARYEWTAGRFGNSSSVFTTSDPALHRIRRGALNPMFSKQAIRNFEPQIWTIADNLYRNIATYKETGEVITISDAFSCLTGDVITDYFFGINYKHIDSKGFKENFHAAFMGACSFSHLALQFPWFHPLMNALPESWNRKMNPILNNLLTFQRHLRQKISSITNERDKGITWLEHPTIFHTILNSDIPPSEKSVLRLAHEAQIIMGAGVETTAWALSVGTFYILDLPQVYDKLFTELKAAIPDPSAPGAFDMQVLEKLLYLRCCIRESIRLSIGVTARNHRILSTPLTYGKWVVPPHTPVSMTIQDVHFDEEVYDKPKQFIPERWLGESPKALNGLPLENYFVAFGKGPRTCLGINLAHTELYMVFASLFRRLKFELFDTDESDIEYLHDFFLPSPRLDSKGIRVKVVEVDV